MEYQKITVTWVREKMKVHELTEQDFSKKIHYNFADFSKILNSYTVTRSGGKTQTYKLTPRLKLLIWLFFYHLEAEKEKEKTT